GDQPEAVTRQRLQPADRQAHADRASARTRVGDRGLGAVGLRRAVLKEVGGVLPRGMDGSRERRGGGASRLRRSARDSRSGRARSMGGQIAQTIGAAGMPVLLKDIDEQLVQAGLDEARNVSQGQVAKLVERGKLSAEQSERALEEIISRIRGTTSYEGFGAVDFVIE